MFEHVQTCIILNLNKFRHVSTGSDMLENPMNCNNSYHALGAFYPAILDSILLSLVNERKSERFIWFLNLKVRFRHMTHVKVGESQIEKRICLNRTVFFCKKWTPCWSMSSKLHHWGHVNVCRCTTVHLSYEINLL